jgi:hypothetical protein
VPGKFRLSCLECNREDFEFVDELPTDWEDIHRMQTLAESMREVDPDDQSRSPLDWETHLGVCPDCRGSGP